MIVLRSLIFSVVFWAFSTLAAILMLPLLLAPRSWMRAAVVGWVAVVVVLVRWICGVRLEIRGREHLPTGAALVAAKHHCMLDTMAPFAALPDACYVLRRTLLRIPFYGWYTQKAGIIAVDREGRAKALRQLLADARRQIAGRRQIVIFPEGTRTAPGQSQPYKPGVAALYRDLGVACTPLATNSGLHWPAHGFIRRPGLIVYEFLPPIPPGLDRAEFMDMLRERIETASAALALA